MQIDRCHHAGQSVRQMAKYALTCWQRCLSLAACVAANLTAPTPVQRQQYVSLSPPHSCQQGAVHRPADFAVYVQLLKTPASSTGVNGGTYFPASPVPGDAIAAHHGVPSRQKVNKFARTWFTYTASKYSPNSQRICFAVRRCLIVCQVNDSAADQS